MILKVIKNTISIDNGAKILRFHLTWLRDNCQCHSCLHPQTKQKLVSSGSVADITVKKLKANSGSLEITWADHVSKFDKTFLERYDYSKPFKPLIEPVLWNAKEFQERQKIVDYEDFLKPEGFRSVLSQIRDLGLAFIKNCPTDDETSVEKVAQEFGVVRNSFYGKLWNVQNDLNSKNIAYTSLDLGYHMDLLYFECPPGLQLLHCLRNSVIGGSSIFFDVFGAVERLKAKDSKAFDTLCRVPVRFHYENDGKHFEYLRPTIEPSLNDGWNVFYAPQFQGPIHCKPEDVDQFYDAFRQFEDLLQDEKYQLKHMLNPGEVALFANRRVLHGREQFDPRSGERWLKGTYVGWDEVKDRIRMNFKL